MVFAISMVALAPAPATAATVPAEVVVFGWRKQTSHLLAGKILRTASGEVVDGVALSASAATGTPIASALGIKGPAYVLLGEVHDNPEHHWLRAGLILPLTEPGPYGPLIHPGVVSEHIADTQAAVVGALGQSGPRTAEAFFAAVEWDKSGWPAAKMFEPLFAAVFDRRLSLLAGNIASAEIRSLVRGGRASASLERREKLGLDRTLPTPLLQALGGELKGSHCGMLPDTAIDGMALAQHARDASMAHAMVQAVDQHGRSVLLAGNGHVRTDRGVPWHIQQLRPNARVVAVMLAEVEDGRDDPMTYVPRDPDGKPAVDYVIFTPRVVREDPCEKMRTHMQKKG